MMDRRRFLWALPAAALTLTSRRTWAQADPPAGLAEAEAIRAAGAALRAPGATPATLAPHGQLTQRIYRALALDPALEAATLGHLTAAGDAPLRTMVTTNAQATRAIMGTVGQKRTQMPDWRIVSPAPAAELTGYYQEAEATFGVPWEILAAIHLVETRMGRLRGVSTAGARGPMQFIPETWARFGEGDIEDNRDAIFAAARHQKHHGAPADLDRALWHYNPTDRYVRAVRGYAALIEADPLHYWLYHAWQVYYTTVRGYLLLPEGYALTGPTSVVVWCDADPTRCP